jgi:hypothetical protein
MTKLYWICSALFAASLATNALAQSGVATQTVLTVMPKSGSQAPEVTTQQIQANIAGKRTQVTNWIPLRGDRGGLQMMILIDGSARARLSLQYDDLRKFVMGLPDGTQVGIAYMQNGQAVIAQNLTADRQRAANAFRMTSGVPGGNGSPYFCLSDLVKKWPAGGTSTPAASDRREVLMVTDGVDLYYGNTYDSNDPYVQSAISDSQKAGVLVYSIFFKDTGRFDNSRWTVFGAQNYLLQVSTGTGGRAYWIGDSSPVSFSPFLDDLSTRIKNQYELGLLAAPGKKTQLQPLKVKISAPGMKVDAPQAVVVPGSESAPR